MSYVIEIGKASRNFRVLAEITGKTQESLIRIFYKSQNRRPCSKFSVNGETAVRQRFLDPEDVTHSATRQGSHREAAWPWQGGGKILYWNIEGERRIEFVIPIAVGEHRISFFRLPVKAGGNRNAWLHLQAIFSSDCRDT